MSVHRKGDFQPKSARVDNGIKRGLILSGKLVAQRGSQKAPRKTGRLKRDIAEGQPFVIADRRYGIDVGTNVEYAAVQEFGATINIPEIRPRNKKALAFAWPGAPPGMAPGKGGKFVFAKVAAHTVTIPAHPYLRPALRESKGDITRILLKSIIGSLKAKGSTGR